LRLLGGLAQFNDAAILNGAGIGRDGLLHELAELGPAVLDGLLFDGALLGLGVANGEDEENEKDFHATSGGLRY
jgi:hypothetical protein